VLGKNRTNVIFRQKITHTDVPQIVLESKLWINTPETLTMVV